jgi:hypothetical protein
LPTVLSTVSLTGSQLETHLVSRSDAPLDLLLVLLWVRESAQQMEKPWDLHSVRLMAKRWG